MPAFESGTCSDLCTELPQRRRQVDCSLTLVTHEPRILEGQAQLHSKEWHKVGQNAKPRGAWLTKPEFADKIDSMPGTSSKSMYLLSMLALMETCQPSSTS